MARRTLNRNILGNRFGRLVVTRNPNKNAIVKCQCDCGAVIRVIIYSLHSGNTTSCGCFKQEVLRQRCTTHNQSRRTNTTKEYRTWAHIKKRCYNKKSPDYVDYGGRGLKVCRRWLAAFSNFFEDMGVAPTPTHSIDRIDNSKGYSPSNCRWATPKEQVNNSSKVVVLTHNGITLNVTEWATELQVQRKTICARINRLGWSVEKALTTPVRSHHK